MEARGNAVVRLRELDLRKAEIESNERIRLAEIAAMSARGQGFNVAEQE